MGCDIHGVVQVRWGDDKWWETVQDIDRERNYNLFSALAGVRNAYDIKPISEPRGLPADFLGGEDHPWEPVFVDGCVVTWMGDHSHSWLTPMEIEEWPGWTDELRASVGERFFAWLRWIRLAYNDSTEARIVFGFDN